MKVNYQLELDKIIEKISEDGNKAKLLIHSCCGPCSSYVLDYLDKYFDISIFYYNPNIFPQEEFNYRSKEQEELINKMGLSVKFIGQEHMSQEFYDTIKGHEDAPEKGSRCGLCYRLRLEKTAQYALENSYDYFTTTLSISPHKDSQLLNQIGRDLEKEYGVKYLYSDFKKKDGYRKSVEFSKKFDMYRQEYCGCEFSYRAYENRKEEI